MTEELKCCPFCGKLPIIIESYNWCRVICNNQNCYITPSLGRQERKDTIDSWNTFVKEGGHYRKNPNEIKLNEYKIYYSGWGIEKGNYKIILARTAKQAIKKLNKEVNEDIEKQGLNASDFEPPKIENIEILGRDVTLTEYD